jgi:hypothetical protein
MPIDVGDAVGNLAARALRLPLVTTITKNPVYTALCIAAILTFIVLIVFRDVNSNESLLTMCLRVGFWAFLFNVGIIFLHNKVLLNDISEGRYNSSYEDTITGRGPGSGLPGAMNPPSVSDNIVPITINTDFTNM